MGWGIEFNTDVFISKQDYKENPAMVEDAIDECIENINDAFTMLCMYASSTVKDIVPEEWHEDAASFIRNKVDDEVEIIRENTENMVKLRLYYEYLTEKHEQQ